ncbi:chain-length determining protein [Loktanella sp. 22II-4b]|nr:chain-length determining protein [Loktanella sp. 22II-4b]
MAREENGEINLGQIFRTLWRGKFWIILASLVTLLIGGYYAFVMAVPTYTATATVALESRQEQVVDIESVMTGLSGDQITINTEVEVIRSRELIGRLADRLNLAEDPEFNFWIRPKPAISLGVVIGLVRELILGPAPELPPPSAQTVRDSVINMVLGRIFVSNVRQSYVFEITAVTEDPEKSALIANTLAELYIRDQLDVKFAATEKATEFLTERVSQLQVELEAAESAAKAFNAGTDLVSPEALIGLNRQIKELRDRLGEARTAQAQAEARVTALEEAAAAADTERMAALANDRTLDRIATLMRNNPATGRASFDDRYEQIVARARLEADRNAAQIRALESTIAQQEAQIERQSGDLVRLQQLEREAEASRLIYEYFLNRLKETSVQQGIQQADSRLLSRAVVPLSPAAPRKSMILALSLVLGAFLGATLILAREFAQNTFRVAEEMEMRTGYPVIGQIPAIPARRRKNVLKYLTEKPTSAAAEAIRNLRTSLLLSDIDSPPQIIMSTSSIPGEGKTTQSLALSQNLSGLGKKVLLIEGDIRRRVFAEYFDIEGRQGLLAVLSGEVALEDVVFHEERMKADILVGEKSAINAADVFSSERFTRFLAELRQKYDYIIIDTPPVLAVPDARVIGQSVDAIIYTVKWDSTSHRQVLDGLKSFENVNLRVSGLVLSQINHRGMKSYGYGDGYGSYSGYYDN